MKISEIYATTKAFASVNPANLKKLHIWLRTMFKSLKAFWIMCVEDLHFGSINKISESYASLKASAFVNLENLTKLHS